MTDKIKDWYEEANKELKTKPKVDKTFKNHYIKNNSMIALICATGCGKSNAIIDLSGRITISSGAPISKNLINTSGKQLKKFFVQTANGEVAIFNICL
jgi:ABC-type phosphate/phosphonate transport system ATPase subunit